MVERSGNPTVVSVYDDSDNETNRMGCRRLACAVINQAIIDMQAQTRPNKHSSRVHERDAATAFLVSTSWEWTRQRGFWAELAGMEPDLLAARARELIQ